MYPFMVLSVPYLVISLIWLLCIHIWCRFHMLMQNYCNLRYLLLVTQTRMLTKCSLDTGPLTHCFQSAFNLFKIFIHLSSLSL